MDWTIGKHCVPGQASRPAGGFFRRLRQRRAILPAAALLLLGWAVSPAQAGMTLTGTDETVANQAILPSSAPTAVIAFNTSTTTPDNVTRTADSLTVTLTGVNNFSTSNIAAVYLCQDSGVTSGTFSYDNLGLGGSTGIPPTDGIYLTSRCLAYYGAANLPAGISTRLGGVATNMSFTSTIRSMGLPGNDTGGNAGADLFIVIQTSDSLQHRSSFRVSATYTPGIYPPATAQPTATVTVNTNTLTCEYYALNMTDRSDYHGWNWGMVHLGGVDGFPFGSGNIMGINTPYLLFGLNIAGPSGMTSSGNTTEYLSGLEVLFTNITGGAMFASHPIATYPDVSIWEDTNNNGVFDPTFEVTSGGAAGGDRLIGPPDTSGGPTGTQRAHNGGAMTPVIDGTNTNRTAYVASERAIDLEATADNRVDFFVCLTTDPSHIWVLSTPQYGEEFDADLNDNPVGTRSINFWYARQSGTDPVTGNTKAVLDVIRAAPDAGQVLGAPEPVAMTTAMAINKMQSPEGTIEADGFPAPIFNFNLADGTGLGANESIEQIRIWFSGAGFKPTDIMPLTDDEFSGVSLWWDNKTAGMAKADDQLGQFDPPQGVTWLGQTQNGQNLHSTTFNDTNLPLSSGSLTWYNGGDSTPWSPYNDTGPDYYVVLRPKAPIALPPNDYDWQDNPAHGHSTVGTVTGPNYRGPDLFVCVRANGMKNASYGGTWWERGIDFGDEMIATMKDPNDITFTRTGVNASPDQFPKSTTNTLQTIPLAYNVLTTRDNQPISPYYNTAVVGINLVAPDRTLFTGATVWRTLDSIAAAANGSAAFTVSPRPLTVGDTVTISGAGSYDGYRIVTVVNGDTFQVSPIGSVEAFAGGATVTGTSGTPPALTAVAAAGDGTALFTAAGHTLAVGQFATIAGTGAYDDLYVVTAVAGATFQVSPRYAAKRFASATVTGILGSTKLESVADTTAESAVFAAPGHQLVVGQPATITGTGTTDGLYVVTAANTAVGTFEVGPRYVGQAFVGATVTGAFDGTTPLESVATGAVGERAVFTALGHNLAVGETVTIAGTPSYDGQYVVTDSDPVLGTFQTAPRYVAETFGKVNGVLLTAVNFGPNGSALFTAPGHALSVGDPATISGTTKYLADNSYYDGDYVVTAVAGDTFQVAPPCTPIPLVGATVNVATPLNSVAAAANGSVSFTAPGHGLVAGGVATVAGAGSYDGQYIVTAVAGDAFEVVRRHLAQTFPAASINGTPMSVSVASAANGHAVFTAVGHGLSAGNTVTVSNASSYTGTYVVLTTTVDTFEVAPAYVAEQFAAVNGTKPLTAVTSGTNGRAVFTSPNHGLAVDATATISGTTVYDGTFVVTARTTNTFEVAPQGSTADYANGLVKTTLTNATQDGTNGSAYFTAPNRTLSVGDPVAIDGTANYDDDFYTVTGVSGGNLFWVAPT